MCSEPITANGVTFACRQCNQCITARKNDWVARAMAEKDTSNEVLVANLTYRNRQDGTKPDAARAFRYVDAQRFLKALREEYYRTYKAPRNEVRYIIAGERGSKKNRVHWHLILFAQKPISTLGKWQDKNFNDIPEMKLGKKLRQHWSYWPHGHVNMQVPDQGGMAYVLKYALKDQFNSVKSKGTMRFTKSENNGASMFRMSKLPPIGFRWIESRCDDWEKRGVVPVKLELKVPEYSGFWWPKGDQRTYLLERLHQINETIKKQTGRDAPQWNTLLYSVVNNEKDWEALHYGTQEEQTDEYEYESWKTQLDSQQKARAATANAKQIKYRCGGALICKPCWRGKNKEEKAHYRKWYEAQQQEHERAAQSKKQSLDKFYRKQGAINPYCTLKDTPARKQAFNIT